MEKTKIEWADSSWNPVTGCYHSCPYCYARGTANRFKGCDDAPDGVAPGRIVHLKERLKVTDRNGNARNAAYPYGFTPTLHEYRLNDPATKGFGKTIFVCSMSDLFGEWVPEEWIIKVFDACKAAPGHRYLFLTKNPERYWDLAKKGLLPKGDEYWYGSTVTDPYTEAFWAEEYNTFISMEPILEPMGNADTDENGKIPADYIDWIILGAETGNRKDKVVPERSWIEDIVQEFKDRGKPVFMKDSMIPIWGEEILTELPWEK